jgi:hypothetical protein
LTRNIGRRARDFAAVSLTEKRCPANKPKNNLKVVPDSFKKRRPRGFLRPLSPPPRTSREFLALIIFMPNFLSAPKVTRQSSLRGKFRMRVGPFEMELRIIARWAIDLSPQRLSRPLKQAAGLITKDFI